MTRNITEFKHDYRLDYEAIILHIKWILFAKDLLFLSKFLTKFCIFY